MSCKAYHASRDATLYVGDCREVLASLSECSVDAVVTDPPYELGFMGKSWDSAGVSFSPETWAAVLRVLKPGGYLLAFGGSRTFHRIAVAIEDAGFEVRDTLSWLYGTGFPKSLNLGDGRGTALKPAWEPIILARKPLAGTVAANVQAHGTGALNIDGCRIATDEVIPPFGSPKKSSGGIMNGTDAARPAFIQNISGRWPANVVLDEEAAAALDAQTGTLKSGSMKAGVYAGRKSTVYSPDAGRPLAADIVGSEGGASRFFYVAKASRSERELGGVRNIHPTVKPVELMRWLVRLVTPPGGAVLDPFTGSGSTGVATLREGVAFVGIEQSAEYAEIARGRITHAAATSPRGDEPAQGDLFSSGGGR